MFVVGGEENKLVVEIMVFLGRWIYLCSIWNLEKGFIFLWVNGELVVIIVEMVIGYIVFEGGIL